HLLDSFLHAHHLFTLHTECTNILFDAFQSILCLSSSFLGKNDVRRKTEGRTDSVESTQLVKSVKRSVVARFLSLSQE
ncbi:hypothetical protein PMAYCL1PPCAC_00466, partial [Pristionchus mayeri]